MNETKSTRHGRIRGSRGMVATVAVAGLALPLVFSLTSAGASSLTSTAPAAASVQAAANLNFVNTWTAGATPGAAIAESSPTVADLSGGPAAVVGDRAGNLYAFNLATGAREWVVGHGVGIDGSPSAANVGGGGDSVFVGIGTSANGAAGYYQALNPNGSVKWNQNATNPAIPGVTSASAPSGVASGLAVGTLQGQAAVVGGSMGFFEHAFNAVTSAPLAGFPWLAADSNFSTPAIADIEGNGTNQIVLGGDSTAGDGGTYQNGGHIRILSQTGNQGAAANGGLYCQYNANQVVQSSPAVGEFLAGGAAGAVVGTGSFWNGASQTNALLAIDKHCNLAWQANLDGLTEGSPALADVLGNGALQVVEGTDQGAGGAGSVYALNGANGATIWRHDNPANDRVIGSVVTVDLGSGYQDVIDPTTDGVFVLDGRTGATVATLETGLGTQNAPLVTTDPNGTIGITVAGYNGGGGVVEHFELPRSNGSKVNEAGAWPEFHHDRQLSGNAGTPPPVIAVACKAPARASGYLMSASDGGIFTFGNLPFCGSTGGIVLNRPVVGLSMTHSGGGYWLVASDGGIFAFGNAAFHGSAGGQHLNQPIVGMASTPDGRGYWLVASDGGIFAYGDAVFHGSAGGQHLNQPIVGMSADPATGGYWLVASDGGIFGYHAPFLGSTGGQHLNQPIRSMAVTDGGRGYRLVATDGGIFDFGAATFQGSEGGRHLNQPIMGMASS